jgi:hypothetical protein
MAQTQLFMRDAHGLIIAPGARVRSGDIEGTVRRVEPQYGMVTIIVETRTGKGERMVPAATVEVLEEAPRPAAAMAHHDEAHELSFLRKYIFSLDHKIIGIQYMLTSLFMVVGGTWPC